MTLLPKTDESSSSYGPQWTVDVKHWPQGASGPKHQSLPLLGLHLGGHAGLQTPTDPSCLRELPPYL